MRHFSVRGVVKGGQVVLEVPLDVPDGTEVTVTEGALGVSGPACTDAEKRKLLTAYNRLDLIDDPDWEEKAKEDRVAAVERLVREAANLREGRLMTATELEKQPASRS